MQLSRGGVQTNLPQGDTYDLLVVDTPSGYPSGQLLFQFAANPGGQSTVSPRKIAGLQKVAQTFLRMLMTTASSDIIYPNMGTQFPSLALQSNRSGSDSVFVSAISTAVQSAANQTKIILNGPGVDLSAQLSELILLGVTAVDDSLSMYLQMITMDGVQSSIAIPFPQLNLPMSNPQ